MNIKNRIKKLTEKRKSDAPKGSDICECFENFLETMVNKFYDGEAVPRFAAISAGICPDCSKPVGSASLELQNNLQRGLEKAYGGNYEFEKTN